MKIPNAPKFKAAPEGVFEAICVDVVDLGIVSSNYGPKHKLKVAWEIEEKMEDGRPFIVSQRYTATLGKQSNLRAALTSWRGRGFTEDELRDFEMDTIIGAPCMIVVKHNVNDGETYANVSDVLKSKNPIKATGKYTRAKDRDGYKAPELPGESASAQPDAPDKADGIPF
jgi:hypothetical protein